MKIQPPKDDWKYRKPKVAGVRDECGKCGSTDLRITGLRKEPDRIVYRIHCRCGESIVGFVGEHELVQFFLLPDTRELLRAFLPKPRSKEPQQGDLL